MDLQQALRERIESDLRSKQWTQADLCTVTGINPSKVSRFLAGKAEIDIGDLEAISRAFDLLPGDYLPNSNAITPEIARLAKRIAAFSPAEQFYLMQALDSLIEARRACVEQAREAFGGVAAGIRRRRTDEERPPAC